MGGQRLPAKVTEAALQASDIRFHALVENNADIIALLDQEGTILYVSQAVTRMLGKPPSAWIGERLADHATDDDREALEALIAACGASPDVPVRRELRMRAADGSEHTLELVLTNRLDHAALGVIVCNAGDVTHQKEMQARLQLSDRMASIGTLAAGVAHEINNPLAVIIGNLDLLTSKLGLGRPEAAIAATPAGRHADAVSRETIGEILQDASEAAERVRLIVRDLKLFSRAEAETRGPVEIERLIDSSLRMAWNEVRHHARVVKDLQPVPPVLANEARLGQVFINLLVNAAQAIPDGHAEENEIRIACWANPDRTVAVEIRDSGKGIAPDVLPRIFDPFFTTKAVGVGTGLGLAICHSIVVELGGTITVSSKPNLGTAFRVTLPATTALAATSRAPAPSSAPDRGPRRRGRVLVVDDEPMIQSFVSRTLRDRHDVTVDDSADSALARLREGARFDAILCDVMMPQTSGIDFYGAVAAMAPEQAARVVFISAGAFTAEAQQFLENTPQPLIDKPFDPRTLRMVVDQMVR